MIVQLMSVSKSMYNDIYPIYSYTIVLCFLVTALSGNTPPVQTVSDLQRKVFCTAGVVYKPGSANIKLVHRFL